MNFLLRPPPSGYDIIGDVHGERLLLERLLVRLGYRPEKGIWRHPHGREPIFLGDLLDHGPDVAGVVRLVRLMVDAGVANLLLGNHEFNALALSTPDGRGAWLREHTPKKLRDTAATRRSFHGHEAEMRGHLEWLAEQPAALDLGSLRVVHAAWMPDAVRTLAGIPRWDADRLHAASAAGSALKAAREALFNGPEAPLPADTTFVDWQGNRRTEVRIRWWDDGRPYRWSTTHIRPEPGFPDLPDEPVPVPPGGLYCDPVPVFFGHYRLPADHPGVLTPHVACLDFSAGKGGALGAYRFDGESTLDPTKIIKEFP